MWSATLWRGGLRAETSWWPLVSCPTRFQRNIAQECARWPQEGAWEQKHRGEPKMQDSLFQAEFANAFMTKMWWCTYQKGYSSPRNDKMIVEDHSQVFVQTSTNLWQAKWPSREMSRAKEFPPDKGRLWARWLPMIRAIPQLCVPFVLLSMTGYPSCTSSSTK